MGLHFDGEPGGQVLGCLFTFDGRLFHAGRDSRDGRTSENRVVMARSVQFSAEQIGLGKYRSLRQTQSTDIFGV